MTHLFFRSPIAALLLALCASNATPAMPDNPLDKETRIIEEKTAGLHVRQPKEEEAWREMLSEKPLGNPDNAAQQNARNAVEAAKEQKPLIQHYSEDIWAKVQTPASAPSNADEDYLEKLARQNREAEPYDNSHLYVFISESIPLVTLRNYQNALEGLPVTYVLRGLVGENPGMLQPTQEWTQRFLCGDGPYEAGSKCFLNPVDINPNLFRIFGIETVPALVYLPQPEVIASCGLSALPENDYLLWYGDVAPAYVLEQFQKSRPMDNILTELIGRVKR